MGDRSFRRPHAGRGHTEFFLEIRHGLRDLGLRVLVVPPDPTQPGLVYPANAGFMKDVDAEQPLASRRFTLANLLPSRAGEKRSREGIALPRAVLAELAAVAARLRVRKTWTSEEET